MKVWENIIGYEGIYQINKKGDVKSLKRNTPGTFTSIDKIINASRLPAKININKTTVSLMFVL